MAYDALMTSNPAVAYNPDKNELLMSYKAVNKETDNYRGGKVRFMAAFADSPLGPFVKTNQSIYEMKGTDKLHMVAEDPYLWYQNHKYYSLVRDADGIYTGDKHALALLESSDGNQWVKTAYPLFIASKFQWADGTISEQQLERPQLLFKDDMPIMLFSATGTTVNGVHRANTFNVFVPIDN